MRPKCPNFHQLYSCEGWRTNIERREEFFFSVSKEGEQKGMPVTSAVFIEPRNHRTLDAVIQNMRQTLPTDIPIHLHHGTKNEELAKAIAETTPNVVLTNMGVDNLTIGHYSTYMTQSKLYDSLPKGQTIVSQVDAGICNPSAPDNMDRLNKFEAYDYVGAPWRWWTGRKGLGEFEGVGGNGGMSVRNTEAMSRLSRQLEEASTETNVSCGMNLVTDCGVDGSTNPDPSCVAACHNIASKQRHPEDVKLSKACSRDSTCRLPDVFEASELNSQHADWTAQSVDSEVFVTDEGTRCLKTDDLSPIAWHKPFNPCVQAQNCPQRDLLPYHKGRGANNLSEQELAEEIGRIRSRSKII